jgi:hypothetical protein
MLPALVSFSGEALMRSTAFEQLGLYPNASRREVERAWRRYALRHHPDRGGDTEAFVRGQQAYDTIIDEFQYRYFAASRQAFYTHGQAAVAVLAPDTSLLIPAGYRFAVGVLAALLQFIFFWTRPLAVTGVFFFVLMAFKPLMPWAKPMPIDVLTRTCLIFGIGFACLLLEIAMVPYRLEDWLGEVYSRREEARRQQRSLGKLGAVNRYTYALQDGSVVAVLLGLTLVMFLLGMSILGDPKVPDKNLFFHPLWLGYGGIWFWWTWIHNERRARRLRPWFIGGMVTAFFLMIHFSVG